MAATDLPPIFVISLVGSKRRENIARQLSRWPGTWSFIDAVYGRDLTDEDVARCYDERAVIRRIGRPMTRGEIGNSLSHLSIYRRMIEEGIPRAIVLEDDALLEDGFFHFPFKDVDWHFDVITFYTDISLIRVKLERALAGITFHRPVRRASCTVSYLISLQGAERLLKGNTPIKGVSDWPVRVTQMAFFVAQPFLVHHRHEISTLQKDRAELLTRYPKRGRLPRWVVKWLDVPVTALFIRYLVNHDRYEGVSHYVYKEILPSIYKRFPGRYRRLRRKAATERVFEER
jgi:glycosyl transferase family 25